MLIRRKLKIFLGGYVNEPNAQNVNCDCIARYLDKEKFDIHICYDSTMPIDRSKYKGITLHKVVRHRYLDVVTKIIAMQRSNCDIYYLPKREAADVKFAQRNKYKKILIASIEGNVNSPSNQNQFYHDYYTKVMTNSFSISNGVQQLVKEKWQRDFPVLPLGIEARSSCSTHSSIKRIIWVGSVGYHKNPLTFLEVAKHFPDIEFIMIGKGNMESQVKEQVKKDSLKNVFLLGQLPNEKIYQEMERCDLLLMTSEYEGLPKVIQEAGACGLPSIYINKQYKVDFIDDWVNGIGVSSIREMIEAVKRLIQEPETYCKMSNVAFETSKKYTWPILISRYEDYFLGIMGTKR